MPISSSSSSSLREMLFSPLTVKSTQSTHSCQIPDSMKFSESSTQTPAADADVINEDICAVCLEIPGEKNVVTTACGHRFCMSCLLSSLRTKNTCPTCRAEIEPSRQESIQPLTVTVAAEIIQNEERDIDITRRIAVIGAFSCPRGRGAMIQSLCREFAFGAAHSLAGWQGTSDDIYHSSWHEYEYNDYNSDTSSDGDDSDDSGYEHEPIEVAPQLENQRWASEVVNEVLPAPLPAPYVSESRIEEVESFEAPPVLPDNLVRISLPVRAAVTGIIYGCVIAFISIINSIINSIV